MTEVEILRELMNPSNMKNRAGEEDMDNSDDDADNPHQSGSEFEGSKTELLNNEEEASKPRQPSKSDEAMHLDKKGEESDNEDATSEDEGDEHDFLLDMDEQRMQMENLGTLLSAFFQDDKGMNVVEAIVQNSKVQNKISKTLERLAENLSKTK